MRFLFRQYPGNLHRKVLFLGCTKLPFLKDPGIQEAEAQRCLGVCCAFSLFLCSHSGSPLLPHRSPQSALIKHRHRGLAPDDFNSIALPWGPRTLVFKAPKVSLVCVWEWRLMDSQGWDIPYNQDFRLLTRLAANPQDGWLVFLRSCRKYDEHSQFIGEFEDLPPRFRICL